MVSKIVTVKNPVLRAIAKPVGKIDKKILELIKEMKAILVVQNWAVGD